VSARFLDPAILSRIGNLELLARTVVDGFISGLHQSPYLGLSTDFAEHRPYLPGDDIRRVDWRLWGRTDRWYVKEFEADTNANVVVLLDVSRSMAYGSGSITKLDYARFLVASLGYLVDLQGDRLALQVLAGKAAPRSGEVSLAALLHRLETLLPQGRWPEWH